MTNTTGNKKLEALSDALDAVLAKGTSNPTKTDYETVKGFKGDLENLCATILSPLEVDQREELLEEASFVLDEFEKAFEYHGKWCSE
ncbi:hypothetical protein HZC00_05195 [Candidatus Kaiserbacteria bacterium]|nr:hypothetical protein [Candidatus Kaiserbacteria bacterium]